MLGQNVEMVFPMAASNGTGDSGTMLGIPRFSTFIHHSAARPSDKRVHVGILNDRRAVLQDSSLLAVVFLTI